MTNLSKIDAKIHPQISLKLDLAAERVVRGAKLIRLSWSRTDFHLILDLALSNNQSNHDSTDSVPN